MSPFLLYYHHTIILQRKVEFAAPGTALVQFPTMSIGGGVGGVNFLNACINTVHSAKLLPLSF
jgi:hypothetical protein